MSKRADANDPTRQARFVFKGTVRRLKAANVAGVEKTDRTFIVRVDEILRAPAALSDLVGTEITVQLRGRKQVEADTLYTFYADGWIFGENIAVEAIDIKKVTRSRGARALAAADPQKALKRADLRERVATADIVVTGRVTTVRLPEDAEPVRATASRGRRRGARAGVASEPRREPISEHNPHWREAVVQVEHVEKGKPTLKEVVVRFPASRDVRWYRAPKFEAGQEGVFILHETLPPQASEAKRGARAVAATVTAVEAGGKRAFTALHPADFQPLTEADEVQFLMNTPQDADE